MCACTENNYPPNHIQHSPSLHSTSLGTQLLSSPKYLPFNRKRNLRISTGGAASPQLWGPPSARCAHTSAGDMQRIPKITSEHLPTCTAGQVLAMPEHVVASAYKQERWLLTVLQAGPLKMKRASRKPQISFLFLPWRAQQKAQEKENAFESKQTLHRKRKIFARPADYP